MPPIKTTLQSDKTPSELFAAILHIAQTGKHMITGVSNETHQLLFHSTMTMMSFGHQYFAVVKSTPGGSVLELITANRPNVPMSMIDDRKNKKSGQKMVEAVTRAISGGPTPATAPIQSFATAHDKSRIPWTTGNYPGA